MTKRSKKEQQGPSSEYRSGRAVPFVPVPWELLDDPECDAYAIATYVALKRFADFGSDHGSRVSDARAAELAGCSARTFRARRAWLKERGWIEWEGKNGRTNVYVVHSSLATAAPGAEVDQATDETAAPDTAAGGAAVTDAEVSDNHGTTCRGQDDEAPVTTAGDAAVESTPAPDAEGPRHQVPTTYSHIPRDTPPPPSSSGPAHVRAGDEAAARTAGEGGVDDLDDEQKWQEFVVQLTRAYPNGFDGAEIRPVWLEFRHILVEEFSAEAIPDENTRRKLTRATLSIVLGDGTEWLRNGVPLPWHRRPTVFRDALRSAATSEERIRHPLDFLQQAVRKRVADLPPDPAAPPAKVTTPGSVREHDRRVEAERRKVDELTALYPEEVQRIEAAVEAELGGAPEDRNERAVWRTMRNAEVRRRVLAELGGVRKSA